MEAVLLLSCGKSKAPVLVLPRPLPSRRGGSYGELTSLFSFLRLSFRQDKSGYSVRGQSLLWGSVGEIVTKGGNRGRIHLFSRWIMVVGRCWAKLKLGRGRRVGKSLVSKP